MRCEPELTGSQDEGLQVPVSSVTPSIRATTSSMIAVLIAPLSESQKSYLVPREEHKRGAGCGLLAIYILTISFQYH